MPTWRPRADIKPEILSYLGHRCVGIFGELLLNCIKEQGCVCTFPEPSLPPGCVARAALGTSVHKAMSFGLWKKRASAALTRSGLTCCCRLGVRAAALLAGYSCPWRYLLPHHAWFSGALPLVIRLKTQLHHYLFSTFSSIFLDHWLKSYKFPSTSLPFLFWIQNRILPKRVRSPATNLLLIWGWCTCTLHTHFSFYEKNVLASLLCSPALTIVEGISRGIPESCGLHSLK